MKNIIKGIVILVLIFSIPSCYSEHLITSGNTNNLKDVYEGNIIYIETKDGRLFKNENKVKIFNSEKGVYVVDSTGTKFLNYNELQSVKVKQFNTWHSVLLFTSVGVGALLIYVVHELSHFRIS